MATYLELKEQAEKLMAQAEQLRQQETEQAIADIKDKMKAYGLTVRDLGFGGSPPPARSGRRNGNSPKAPAKYRGPNGESWSGGRGRKPQWVVDALAQGKSLDQFEIR
ncbi:MAG TPA: H-NS histone family protein [Ramlibacter sp.]|jgi:DNA-binding protein H-NS|uniref:H-NS histone family protein n=1 Tax=Ramlibacter sp. TaxID=1917967 RepID=UPI002D57B6D8|nr:H-NS histone family protein [Ramlibacter sp.]HZY20083.1 H-NS histone family protein [Ramlibacter sp.]